MNAAMQVLTWLVGVLVAVLLTLGIGVLVVALTLVFVWGGLL